MQKKGGTSSEAIRLLRAYSLDLFVEYYPLCTSQEFLADVELPDALLARVRVRALKQADPRGTNDRKKRRQKGTAAEDQPALP